ncbi:MAG: hypothetical protein P8L83_07310 [Flavobacteriaceae bacterium]|nr:hypothetical protein [Flavobacteriaceae bacterium]
MIKNLNNNLGEVVIIIFIVAFILFIAINPSKFKSIDDFKGKQLHKGGHYIGKILSTSKKNFDHTQKLEFKYLNQFIKDNKLSKNGFPFIIHTSHSEESIQYIIAIPIVHCPENTLPLKFVCNYFPKQDVLAVIHEGYLHDRYKGWEMLENEVAKQNIKIFNAPFEVFWKGAEQSKDSTTWLTGLYYPIQ